jgi:bifunctional non-homologous end joining protein LigD
LWTRRALRSTLLEGDRDRIRFSQDFEAPPTQVFEAAAGLGLEDLMLKRRNARYESGRTQTLKNKCRLRQELVICGFTARGGKEGELGSLLLGYYEGSKQGSKHHDAGSVGTGWNARTGRALWRRLALLETDSAPFDIAVTKSRRWVRPELIAEVAFAGWTTTPYRAVSDAAARHHAGPTVFNRGAMFALLLPTSRLDRARIGGIGTRI